MRRTIKWGAVGGLAAVLLLAGAGGGIAQDKLAEIKARQDFMKHQQADVNAINAYAKGKGDKAKALAAADDLLAVNAKIIDQFPPGTSNKDFPGKTRAKPEIWQEMDKVKAIPPKLKVAEEKLADTIKTATPAQVGQEMASVYRNDCTACHGRYRAPEH